MEHLPPLGTFPLTNMNTAMGLAVAAGVLYTFLGYRLFRLILFLTGFVLAGSVAAGLGNLLSNGQQLATAIVGVLGGIAGAMALSFVYKAGVFSVGVLGGVVVALHLLAGQSHGWEIWAIIGAGLAMGLMALVLERPVMTLATASIGAWVIASGLAFFILGAARTPTPDAPIPTGDDRILFLAAWLTLTLVGTFFQLSTRNRTPRPQP